MPYSVQRHCCNVCKEEFRLFDEALVCESSPSEVQKHAVGDVVSYEDESSMFGSRYSYCTDSGTVLFAYQSSVTNKATSIKAHAWIYVIKPFNKPIEVEAAYMSDEFNVMRLVSKAEWKFISGYAENVKSNFLNRV